MIPQVNWQRCNWQKTPLVGINIIIFTVFGQWTTKIISIPNILSAWENACTVYVEFLIVFICMESIAWESSKFTSIFRSECQIAAGNNKKTKKNAIVSQCSMRHKCKINSFLFCNLHNQSLNTRTPSFSFFFSFFCDLSLRRRYFCCFELQNDADGKWFWFCALTLCDLASNRTNTKWTLLKLTQNFIKYFCIRCTRMTIFNFYFKFFDAILRIIIEIELTTNLMKETNLCIVSKSLK